MKDQFTLLTKRAFEQFIGARINERLKGAMTPDPAPAPKVITAVAEAPAEGSAEPVVGTSPEEIEAFHSIRALLRDTVSPRRVFIRDAQSYCAILLDDNNRKPICRLRFNNTQRLRLGLFNETRDEEQVSLETVDDLFNHAERLRATVAAYLASEVASSKS